MRVLIYTLRFNHVSGGGSHSELDILIRALTAKGHTPILTTFFSDGNKYKEKPCEIREEQFEGGFLALQHHLARRMRDEENADIFLVFGSAVMWGGGMYASRGGKIPVVASIFNYTPGMGFHRAAPFNGTMVQRFANDLRNSVHRVKWYAWEKIFGIRYVRAISRAFFDSPVVLEQYRRFGYRFPDTLIIPAPVEKTPVSSDLSSPYPLDPEAFHVLFAGRLIADKGPDLIVRAAIGLPENIQIHILGIGNEEPALRTFIKENKLEERVHLYGWKTPAKLPAFYQHAQVFAHPCRWPEPFGLTASAALGYGLPVITMEGTDGAGDAGLTFKKDDVADLQRCILFFFNNPNALASFREKALVRARLFDAKIVGRQFVDGLEYLAKR